MQRIGVSVSSPLPLASSLSLSSFLFFPPLTRPHPLARRAARLKTPTRIESRGVEWGAFKADLGMARARSLGGLAMRRALLRASCPLPEPPASRRWPFQDASALPRFFLGGGKNRIHRLAPLRLRAKRGMRRRKMRRRSLPNAPDGPKLRGKRRELGGGAGGKRERKRARPAWGRLTKPSAIRPGRRTSAPRSDLPVASPPRRPKWPEDVFPRPPGQALKRFVRKPLCYNPLAARGRVFKPRGQTGEPSPAAAPRGWRRLGGARPRVRRTGPRRGLKKDGRGIPPNSAPGARSRVKHKSGACA